MSDLNSTLNSKSMDEYALAFVHFGLESQLSQFYVAFNETFYTI